MFQEYDCFILTKDIPGEVELHQGTSGVVLMILGNDPPTYEVEFVNSMGNNMGYKFTYTLTEDFMQKTLF
jgi:hypothetical protein